MVNHRRFYLLRDLRTIPQSWSLIKYAKQKNDIFSQKQNTHDEVLLIILTTVSKILISIPKIILQDVFPCQCQAKLMENFSVNKEVDSRDGTAVWLKTEVVRLDFTDYAY